MLFLENSPQDFWKFIADSLVTEIPKVEHLKTARNLLISSVNQQLALKYKIDEIIIKLLSNCDDYQVILLGIQLLSNLMTENKQNTKILANALNMIIKILKSSNQKITHSLLVLLVNNSKDKENIKILLENMELMSQLLQESSRSVGRDSLDFELCYSIIQRLLLEINESQLDLLCLKSKKSLLKLMNSSATAQLRNQDLLVYFAKQLNSLVNSLDYSNVVDLYENSEFLHYLLQIVKYCTEQHWDSYKMIISSNIHFAITSISQLI
jgi:hypothetical protein